MENTIVMEKEERITSKETLLDYLMNEEVNQVAESIRKNYSDFNEYKVSEGTILFTKRMGFVKGMKTNLRNVMMFNILDECPNGFSIMNFNEKNIVFYGLYFNIYVNKNSILIEKEKNSLRDLYEDLKSGVSINKIERQHAILNMIQKRLELLR